MKPVISCYDSIEIMSNLRERILNMDINDVDNIFNYIHPNLTTDKYYKPLILDLIQQILYYKLCDNKKAILCLYFKLLALNFYNIDLTKIYFKKNYNYKFEYKGYIYDVVSKSSLFDDESHIDSTFEDIQEGDKILIYNKDNELLLSLVIKKISYLNNYFFIKETKIFHEQEKIIKLVYDPNYIDVELSYINYDLITTEIENNNIGHIFNDKFHELYDKISEFVDYNKNDELDNFINYYNNHQYTHKIYYINLSLMFGALKCFKFLCLSGEIKEITYTDYLIIGNNLEMIKISEHMNLNYVNLLLSAIKYDKDYLFEYCLNNIKEITYKEIYEIISLCLIKYNYNMIKLLYNEYNDKILSDDFIKDFYCMSEDINNLNGIILFNKLDKRLCLIVFGKYADNFKDGRIINFTDEFINLLISDKENYYYISHKLIFVLLTQRDINIKTVKRYLKMIYNIDDLEMIYSIISKQLLFDCHYYLGDKYYIDTFINRFYYNDHYKNNIIKDEEEILNCFLGHIHPNKIDISDIDRIHNAESLTNVINVLSTKNINIKFSTLQRYISMFLYNKKFYKSNIENFNNLMVCLIDIYNIKHKGEYYSEMWVLFHEPFLKYNKFENKNDEVNEFIYNNLSNYYKEEYKSYLNKPL